MSPPLDAFRIPGLKTILTGKAEEGCREAQEHSKWIFTKDGKDKWALRRIHRGATDCDKVCLAVVPVLVSCPVI